MASSTDTQVDLVVNEVSSETVLKDMITNNQLQPNEIYTTPDEDNENQVQIGNMYWEYDTTNKVLKAVFTEGA